MLVGSGALLQNISFINIYIYIYIYIYICVYRYHKLIRIQLL